MESVTYWHGPKPGCQEAEAFSILEAETKALTQFSLEAEAEALVKKPKPGYLYSANQGILNPNPGTLNLIGCKVVALVNHEAEAEAFENHEAEARL